MLRFVPLSLALALETLALAMGLGTGCSVPDDLLDQLACPCTDGYECDELRDVCVSRATRDVDLGACLAGASDDFDDEMIDERRWRFVDDNEAMVSETDGVFVGTIPSSSRSDYAFLVTADRVDLRECATVVELIEADTTGVGLTFFSARIANDYSFGWTVRGTGLVAHVFTIDGIDEDVLDVDYDPMQHRWLGLRGNAETMIWLTSPDGAEWTVQAHRPVAFSLEAIEVIFGVGAEQDGPALEGRFDHYNDPPPRP